MPSKTASMRQHPNIAITGTPGTGKSTLAKQLVNLMPVLKLLDINAEAEARDCRDSYDEKLSSWVIDEDKLAGALHEEMERGGNIIDWMHADFWPSSNVIDLVVTLRASTENLHARYTSRGYAESKIQQNLDAEIMNEISMENEDWFGEEGFTTVMEMQGDTSEDMKKNEVTIKKWMDDWYKVSLHEARNGHSRSEEKG